MKIKPVLSSIFRILVISLILSKTCIANETGTSENIYGRLTALQCDSLIKANETNPDFVILDVRTPTEWNGYHIMGSINRSTGLADFTAQLDALPKHKIFLLHCQSGGRSAVAFIKMKELGFAKVYEMIGGISSWNSAGLPTTTIIQPKLMLVSYHEIITESSSDTLKITVTNRANGNLTFGGFSFSDVHILANNFNSETVLPGANDYTFSIVHSPGYSGDDSTKINIESNGGMLELNVVFKNEVIQEIDYHPLNKFAIYPNPASQKLYFKTDSEFIIDDLSVMNISGQIMLRETLISNKNDINISGLKNGIYILQMRAGEMMISKKFIVKN